MTARTAIVPTQAARDAGTTITLAAPDAANGNTVAAGPYNVVLIISNASSSGTQTVTIRATGKGVTASGGAATGNPDLLFTQSSRGDLVVTLPHSAYVVLPITDTDRFTQLDGSLSIDWSTATSITAAVIQSASEALGF